MVINTSSPANTAIYNGLVKSPAEILVLAILLNNGNATDTTSMASSMENVQSEKDSLKNFIISCTLLAPNTFSTPVSFARLSAAAVVRFIKLKQAISRMMPAMANNVYTSLLLLLKNCSENNTSPDCKCISSSGCR